MGTEQPELAHITLGKAEHTEVHVCPYCGAENDAVTGVNGATGPQPGNVSICIRCTRPGMFDRFAGKLVVRVPTEDELTGMYADDDLGAMLRVLDATRPEGV